MLYFKALRDGLDDLPAASATVRAALEARAAAEGWPTLHAELALHDPSTAQRLSPNDGQRIQRALEVWQITGRAISAFHATQSIANKDRIDCGYGSKNTLKNSPDHCLISLEPTDRTWLHQRIHQRFEAMLAQGLVDEVRKLRQRGDLHADLPSMRCVGYRQAWAFLDHADPAPQAMATLRETGLAATRQLAKRQLTWLRSMPERLVLPCDALSADAMLSHTLAAMRAWR
jgi:tRNA dimethylallyltransferase